jgi:predicted RNA-binding protein with PIN domain
MSLYYVIDGYNVLKQIPQLSKRQLPKGRQGLLDIIDKYNLCGKNEATVVFDGHPNIIEKPHKSRFKIIFSEKRTADDVIEKIVRESLNPSRTIVVTNDKELRCRTKKLNAETLSVEEFGKKIPKKGKKKQQKKHLEAKDAHSITEELKRIWLDEM